VQAVSDWFGVAIKPGLATAPSLDHCYSVGLRIVPIRVESEPTRLAQLWVRLEANPRLTVVAGATKTHFHLADGQIVSVGVERPGGRRRDVNARYHVVAAGGIDSARLVYQ
jgi:choline dehydrogenase-like flavoprotein